MAMRGTRHCHLRVGYDPLACDDLAIDFSLHGWLNIDDLVIDSLTRLSTTLVSTSTLLSFRLPRTSVSIIPLAMPAGARAEPGPGLSGISSRKSSHGTAATDVFGHKCGCGEGFPDVPGFSFPYYVPLKRESFPFQRMLSVPSPTLSLSPTTASSLTLSLSPVTVSSLLPCSPTMEAEVVVLPLAFSVCGPTFVDNSEDVSSTSLS